MRLEVWAQVLAHGFHGLRLDGDDDHIRVLNGLRVIGEQLDTVLFSDLGASVGAGIAGADLCSVQTFGQQAADQAGSHVTGSDKGNTRLAHNRSLSKVRQAFSGLAVVSGAKQCSTDPHPCGALGNGRLQVVAHAHRKRV